MSWWVREEDNIIAVVFGLGMGIIVWFVSQWISDDLWADYAGAAGAVVAAFWLMNRHLRARRAAGG